MNKKGTVTIVGGFWLAVGALAVLTATQTSAFRVRKAVEKCEASGQSMCKEMVDSWSSADVLSYIKDDDQGYSQNF